MKAIPRVSLLLGPPGTGKTRKLNDLVNQWLEKIPLNKIAYVSFTKAAINEIVSRCMDQQPGTIRNDFEWFRTVHSTCYRITGARQNGMLDKELIEKFEQIMEGNGYEVELALPSEEEKANKRNIPMYLYHLAVNRFEDVRDIWADGDYDIPYMEVDFIIRSYLEFKKYHKVVDFNDLLTRALDPNLNIYVDVVFLDEAQDLTPLQWKVFWNLFKTARVVYIAGDDDQSIYEWSGVQVQQFLDIKYDRMKVLDKSYRLPENIKNFAEDMVKTIKHRYNKEYKPHEPGGIVKRVFKLDKDELLKSIEEKESWLFLVRNICFADPMQDILQEIGVPYKVFNYPSLREDEIKAIVLWERFRLGKIDLNDMDTEIISKYMSKNRFTQIDKSWFQNFNHMNPDRMEYYRKVLANGFKITGDYSHIELTTIHRVKGREADNVLIVPDITGSTNKLLETHPDQEHRVFYVGATRAKKNLIILEPFTSMYYDFGGLL